MRKWVNPSISLVYLYVLLSICTMAQGPLRSFGPSCAQAARDPDTLLDLIFVIDNSGSMQKNDPGFITPQVVSTFVAQLPGNSQVGMVLFDRKAHLLMPLTRLADANAGQRVTDSLTQIDYRGKYTNTPVGIERALYELKNHGRLDARKGIIFVTDGIVDTGTKSRDRELTQWLKKDIADQCRQLEIRIFGIALTESADFSLIQALATRTNGEYFRTFAAGEISSVLEQIQQLMTPKNKLQPKLAPLPLLPVPNEAPQSKAALAPQPQNDSHSDEGAVVVTKEGAWLISLTLALVIAGLVAALFFFFYQNTKSGRTAPPGTDKGLSFPEAYLEDLDDALGKNVGPIRLDKEQLNIGRSKRNDLVIQQPDISGFHATIWFRNMSFYLEDHQSTNGTMINDRKLTAKDPVRLKNGDSITLAVYRFNFLVVDQNLFGDTVMLSMTALEDPEEAATIVLDLDGANTKEGLVGCMQNHLMQIYGLSAKHKAYVNTYFSHDTLDIIATTAHENLQLTAKDGDQHCTPIIKNKSFYVACSLPGSIETAVEWYGARHNGFTQFIFKWIRSEQYLSAECGQLCIVTFGQSPATWVSITIVPTHSDPNPVEIMSVDFLNHEERSSLGLDFDNHGRVV